jgi:hypothetical protein
MVTHLLSLAFPALLILMGPPAGKGRLARLDHFGIVGVFSCVISNIGLNGSNQCPAAMGRMFDMLVDWVVASLPPIQSFFAQEAYRIVGTVGARTKYKSGSGKLCLLSVSDPSSFVEREMWRIRWLPKSACEAS